MESCDRLAGYWSAFQRTLIIIASYRIVCARVASSDDPQAPTAVGQRTSQISDQILITHSVISGELWWCRRVMAWHGL